MVFFSLAVPTAVLSYYFAVVLVATVAAVAAVAVGLVTVATASVVAACFTATSAGA